MSVGPCTDQLYTWLHRTAKPLLAAESVIQVQSQLTAATVVQRSLKGTDEVNRCGALLDSCLNLLYRHIYPFEYAKSLLYPTIAIC